MSEYLWPVAVGIVTLVVGVTIVVGRHRQRAQKAFSRQLVGHSQATTFVTTEPPPSAPMLPIAPPVIYDQALEEALRAADAERAQRLAEARRLAGLDDPLRERVLRWGTNPTRSWAQRGDPPPWEPPAGVQG